jgi:hypothetical protein
MKRLAMLACLLAAVAAGMLTLTLPAAGQLADAVSDDIVVGSADAIRDETFVANAGLNGLLGNAAARVAVEFANAMREPPFAAPPETLAARLAQIAARVPVEFANATRHFALAAPPGALAGSLGQVGPRVVFEQANANRSVGLAYPKALINDRAAPVIGPPVIKGNKITWATDEFTNTVVRYGTSPADLNMQVIVGGYAKLHEVTMPTAQPGVTYWYQIVATDLSGNSTTSPVYEYRGIVYLYLPAVQRR